MRTEVFFAAALLLLASPALAQPAASGPTREIEAALERQFQERKIALMASESSIERALGRVEGKLEQVLESRRQRDEHVDGRLERIEARIEAVVARIESLVEMLAAVKGGWKVIAVLGGIGGMIGGWIVPAFLKRTMGW